MKGEKAVGFGILLIGYFISSIMSFNTFTGVFSFVGFLLVGYAAIKLLRYNKGFMPLCICAFLMALISVPIAAFDVSSLLLDVPIFSEDIKTQIVSIRAFAEFIFAIGLCYGILKIARETGVDKIAVSAIRNTILYAIAFAMQLVVWIAQEFKIEPLQNIAIGLALPIWYVLCTLIYYILNCIMLFSCYSKICDVADVDMPQKPSRFEFVNKMRQNKEEKRQRYIKEAEKYLEEKKKKQI